MRKPHGVLVLGGRDSGAEELGQELARALGFAHLSVAGVDRPDRLLADIRENPGFVLTGDVAEWGDLLFPYLDLVVCTASPAKARGEPADEDAKWLSACPCPVIKETGTGDPRATAAGIAGRFYVKPGEPWKATIRGLGELQKYRFTVIFAQYGKVGGRWLYCRHKNRDTWETPGGHIENGETTLDCAKRELYEETGATKFYMHPAFDYSGHSPTEFSNGQVFFADVETLGEIPPDSEIAEVRPFVGIPDKMTYPEILPALHERMRQWLGLDKSEEEHWDVLDEARNPTGRTHKRGTPMPDGGLHLVVRAWIMNGKGQFLITKRAPNKIGYPGMWEVPSGSALAGEGSLTAVIREAKEESGVSLLPENARLFSSYRRGSAFFDNWFVRQEFALEDVRLQEGETVAARAATWDEISAMMESGEFIGRDVFAEFDLLETLGRPGRQRSGR